VTLRPFGFLVFGFLIGGHIATQCELIETRALIEERCK